jgi:hypothetical protein
MGLVGGGIGDIGTHAFNLAELMRGRPVERICADLSAVMCRPPGHPEGYLEAFANPYRDFASLLRGMMPVSTVVASSRAGGGWVPLLVQPERII